MPNWCSNVLTVSGQAEDLQKFVFDTLGLPALYPPQVWEKNLERTVPAEKYFCFNALVPTPQEVIDFGYDGHDKKPVDEYGNPIDLMDGYHWSISNWGTKWDVYGDSISPEDMGWTPGCKIIEFDFSTAWTPPAYWFIKVVAMYPNLTFVLHYYECGCYFAGDLYGNNGKCVIDEYDEARCDELFQSIYDDEEEEDESDDSSSAGC